MDDFEKELKQIFLAEAGQLLVDAEQCFLSLESSPKDSNLLDKIFRLAHNLKGSSKAVGFDEMGAFTHELESLLLKLKSGDLLVQSSTVSLLLRSNDHLCKMVQALNADLGAKFDSAQLIEEIHAQMSGTAAVASPASAPEPTASAAAPLDAPSEGPSGAEVETALAPDLSFETLTEATLNEVPKFEEPITEAPIVAAPIQVAPEMKAPPTSTVPNPSGGEESIRVSLARLEKLLNFVGELVILQTVLNEQALGSNPALLRKTAQQMGKVTKEIQDISMSLRMVPVKQTFQKMQRIVRDTSSALGKKINLTLQGEETELDKTVLENLSDPLVHLIRNSVDHGIELPEVRARNGKSETGNIFLRAYHQSGKLVIEVADDGGGIDPDRLLQKAIEKGILKPGTQLSKKDAIALIFAPGFSTKAEVTEVSGRGVGMDVVKTNIERLKGEVHVDSEIGKGTTLRIVLPLTLAIIDGMIVMSHESRYVVPLSHIHESLKPVPGDIRKTAGLGDMLLLRGENLPLYSLAELLGQRRKEEENRDSIALVIRTQATPFAVMVDDIIGRHQVVIKKLGQEVQNLKGLGGSAILGDGKPALILELSELINKKGIGKSA